MWLLTLKLSERVVHEDPEPKRQATGGGGGGGTKCLKCNAMGHKQDWFGCPLFEPKNPNQAQAWSKWLQSKSQKAARMLAGAPPGRPALPPKGVGKKTIPKMDSKAKKGDESD